MYRRLGLSQYLHYGSLSSRGVFLTRSGIKPIRRLKDDQIVMNVTGSDRTGLFGLAASPPEKVQQVDNRSLSMKNNQIVLRLGVVDFSPTAA